MRIFTAFRAFFLTFITIFLFKVFVKNYDIRNTSEINADIFEKKLDRDFLNLFDPT